MTRQAWRPRVSALAAVIVAVSGALALAGDDPKAKGGEDAFGNSPEGAFRSFMVAMMTGDEKALKEVVVLPVDGFEWLLKGEHLPPDQVGQMRAAVARMPIKRLQAGDEVTLPGGRVVKVAPEEVGPDRAVILPEGNPVPTRCQKVKDHWRVDARPVIAGRRAADAARKRQKGQSPPRR